jgi:predicted RND superfamily exporter protein
MASRMDKYSEVEDDSRASKNKDVYDKLYETREYNFSDKIEVPSNEVKLENNARELTREEYQKIISGESVDSKEDSDIAEAIHETREEKIYDINSLIDNVKKQKDEEETKSDHSRNTKYNILTSMDVTKVDLEKTINEEREAIKANKEELSNLLKTINLGISNDLIDIFEDTATTNIEIDEKEVEEAAEEYTDENTFYDGTVVINQKDIESDEVEEKTKSNGFVKALGIILFIVVLVVIGYVVATYVL